jgi:hypothetical protein
MPLCSIFNSPPLPSLTTGPITPGLLQIMPRQREGTSWYHENGPISEHSKEWYARVGSYLRRGKARTSPSEWSKCTLGSSGQSVTSLVEDKLWGSTKLCSGVETGHKMSRLGSLRCLAVLLLGAYGRTLHHSGSVHAQCALSLPASGSETAGLITSWVEPTRRR